MKRYTYVHFDDTGPHRAVLETDPYYLFSKLCVIDLYLRTKTRIYSVKKNLFSKPSPAHHNFSAEEGSFFKIALGTRLFSKVRYFIVLL